jgi:hypothetical protein
MLLAPILGIALALLLAGATNSLMFPLGDDENLQGFGATHETPIPMPTHPPPAAASISGGPVSLSLLIAGAVVVGVLAVVLFFREKSLAKALSE